MSELTIIVIAIGLFSLGYFVVPRVLGAYLKYRGRRLITCPETRKPVGVDVDVKHAAYTALRSGRPELLLSSCTRWPEREDCDQDCLMQIRVAPADCLIRTILTEWYNGKTCFICRRSVGEYHWFDHKPAFLGPNGITVEWDQVSPEELPDVLATYKPVCWDCHICETFRREFSDMVVDRPCAASPGEGPRPHA
jgi:hypothetical protein